MAEDIALCPRCGKRLQTLVAEPSEKEKAMLRRMDVGDFFAENHIDVFRKCSCGFEAHETWFGGKCVSGSIY